MNKSILQWQDIDKTKFVVFITDTAIKTPIRYDPLSPKNICALGKLNFIKIKINIKKNDKI